MMIDRLWISAFRNIEKGLWIFEGQKRIGILGKNGNGKSNFLESIYILINGKSFRGSSLSDSLPFEGSKFSLGMDICGTRLYTEFMKEKGRSFQISGDYSDMASLKRAVQVSYFSSDIVRLLVESPDARRRELDRFCKRYFGDVAQSAYSRYEAVLKQKNRSLKQQDPKMARLFHDQLSDIAALVISFRHQGLTLITDKIGSYHTNFPSIKGLSEVGFSYVSSAHDLGDADKERPYSAMMKGFYEAHIAAELAAGFSLYGPHRDDFSLFLGGRSMTRFYSRGVNKISNILFRLSTYELMKSQFGLPILLFDDVFAEIDADNQKGVLHLLEDFPQLFFTGLTYNEVMEKDSVWYQIENGVMEKK